jgi:pyrimidine-nucleoside phosphorylase
MRAVDIILKKRDGGTLSLDEVRFFVAGVTDGTLPDYQASALLMAIVLRGMTAEETAWLTDAMVRSGVRVDLADIPGVKIDKHSTGGVGDKTSLILAPLAAACGVAVPMMSGRGLGHTGGTLDKLEAIPGFRVDLSLAEMKAALASVGCAMIGQTAQIAPADKKLYALRDVTGTVESIPLISASIMSKKIAEGIDGLVLDVKTGSGAFMKTEADSRRLAESLVSIGNASGVKTEAVISAMDSPLGRAVGNALEVIECLEVLKGKGPSDLIEVSVELTSRMLVLGRAAANRADAQQRVRGAIASGAGFERFRQIVEHQGGDPHIVDDYSRLPAAPERHLVTAPNTGYLARLDAELVGRASVALGAGRDRVEDLVDPAVGIVVIAKPGDPGDYVQAGDPILELHYRDRARLDLALPLAQRSIVVGDARPAPRPLLVGEVH